MNGEWISQKEYCKRHKVNPDTVKKLIYDGKLEVIKTQGGQYRIHVGGDTVSRELYEKEKELRIIAETKLNHILKLLQTN
jgi:excisionase family DNA binding protein